MVCDVGAGLRALFCSTISAFLQPPARRLMRPSRTARSTPAPDSKAGRSFVGLALWLWRCCATSRSILGAKTRWAAQLLVLAVPSSGTGVPPSTLAKVAHGGIVISSPSHAGSFLMRVGVASDKTKPGVCMGTEFCCLPEPDGRFWYFIDGETTHSLCDVWFDPLSAAAGFQRVVRAETASPVGSSRRCPAAPPLRTLAS